MVTGVVVSRDCDGRGKDAISDYNFDHEESG